jgi:hypothetical protein
MEARSSRARANDYAVTHKAGRILAALGNLTVAAVDPVEEGRPYCPAAAGLPVPNTMTFAPIGVRL